jgi:hypothetical protein
MDLVGITLEIPDPFVQNSGLKLSDPGVEEVDTARHNGLVNDVGKHITCHMVSPTMRASTPSARLYLVRIPWGLVR